MASGDSYALHELLHTTSIATEFVERHLLDHTSYNYLSTEAQSLIEQAADSLASAYQKIGEEHLLADYEDEEEEDGEE